jgi:putative sigma-54 modulation protein
MKINIQSLKFDADQKLLAYIEKKLGRLSKFDGIIAADVTMTNEHASMAHGGKAAKIRLEVAGSDLFADSAANTFEEAIDHCYDAIKKQLVKRKEKLQGE